MKISRKSTIVLVFVVKILFSAPNSSAAEANIQKETPFSQLESNNRLFHLVIEREDPLLLGNLVLYYRKEQVKVQLWHTNYIKNGSEAMITTDGDFIIFNQNQTQITWKAPLNETLDCQASKLELTDDGILNLLCPDNGIKWTSSNENSLVYDPNIEDLQPVEEPQCFFMYSEEMMEDFEKRQALALKCLKVKSGKWVFGYGARAITIDDLKCGTLNATSVETIETSELCFSATDIKLKMTLIHVLRFPNEDYYQDYKDVRKKRFKARKLQIEEKWNMALLNHSILSSEGEFERLIITQMALPENSSLSGVIITALLQFGQEISVNEYQSIWQEISNNDTTLTGLKVTESIISNDLQHCPEVSTLQEFVPSDIWTASNLSTDVEPLKLGQSLDLKCPSNLMLSHDNNDLKPTDDKYSIACTTRLTYDPVPRDPKNWPSCVKSCSSRIPYLPRDTTGLERIDSDQPLPAGQHGRYRCKDPSLGVSSGSSEYFEVLCNDAGEYQVPAKLRDWPICSSKTTTVSPLLPVAMKNMLAAMTSRLEFRLEAYAWTGGNGTLIKGKDYMALICIPSAIGIGIFVFLLLCLLRTDSPICKLCEEKEIK